MIQELIGWGSAAIVVPTFATQTYHQWQDRHEPDTSSSALWFFAPVLLGSVGQVVYSAMLGNYIFLVPSAFLLVNNSVGLLIAVARRRAGATLPAEPEVALLLPVKGGRSGRTVPRPRCCRRTPSRRPPNPHQARSFEAS